MRDPKRIDRITARLAEMWKAVPDQRLGQFLGNYVLPEMRQTHAWFIEDDEIEKRLGEHE